MRCIFLRHGPVFKTILSPLKFAASNNEQCNDSVGKEMFAGSIRQVMKHSWIFHLFVTLL